MNLTEQRRAEAAAEADLERIDRENAALTEELNRGRRPATIHLWMISYFDGPLHATWRPATGSLRAMVREHEAKGYKRSKGKQRCTRYTDFGYRKTLMAFRHRETKRQSNLVFFFLSDAEHRARLDRHPNQGLTMQEVNAMRSA